MSGNQLVRCLLRKKEIPGEVGLEIELEGRNINQFLFHYWSVHNEESLVGTDSIEFVLRNPILRKEVPRALEILKRNLQEAEIQYSYRTSVHVHINVLNSKIYQFLNFVFLYYILEETLFEHFSPERRGNHFCLRFSEADNLEKALFHILNTGHYAVGDSIRYASMNMAALKKYGSLEFRNFPGIKNLEDLDTLKDYVALLLKIKDISHMYKNPHEIYWDFVEKPKENFLKIFSESNVPYNKKLITLGLENTTLLINGVDWDTCLKIKALTSEKPLFKTKKSIGLSAFLAQPVQQEEDF